MENGEHKNRTKVVVYGGNGFVGTRVAEQLAKQGACTVCLSRSGYKPIHLKDLPWSENVRWCKGDASQPCTQLLPSADAVVLLVGAAPVPTFSQQAFDDQVFMNGTTNVNAINAAAEAGIKRIVLLGAKIPMLMNTDRFGYVKGKRMALEAARAFSELSDQHTAIVIQPGVIYGTRHLKNGKSIALGSVMKPLSYLMPWQFVSVDDVAKHIAHAALSEEPYSGKFTLVPHSKIWHSSVRSL